MTVHRLRARARDSKRAFELFTYATGLDEDEETMDEAVRLYTQAIHLNPKFALAYVNLGNIYHHRGEPEKAMKLYEDSIAIEDHHAEPHYNIGYLLMEVYKNPAAAITHFERALALSPTFHDCRFNICVACVRSKDWERAQKYLTDYLDMAKKDGQKKSHLVAWAQARLQEIE